MDCRGCGQELTLTFLNLGVSPVANNLLSEGMLREQQSYFPLHPMTCGGCALVQLPEVLSREALFPPDYMYFSSYSTSWLEHSREFSIKAVNMLNLQKNDLVVEVASNDGYLLQFFQEAGIQVLGIEPAKNVADVAIAKGIPTIVGFFGEELALSIVGKKKPKLIVANNVLAHVPDLHDFVEAFSILLAEDGVISFEFPHLVNLIRNNQFDTIYHEHYSYLSLTALNPIFERHGLRIIEVENIPTHGGSLRVAVAHKNSAWISADSVASFFDEESNYDPRDMSIASSLKDQTLKIKLDLIEELVKSKKEGKRVAAYGAAAKGNTLLNYSGISNELIDYVVDLNPHKQGNFLPGSGIPIVNQSTLLRHPPDILLVLPWNIASEIRAQLDKEAHSGMRYLRAIPKLEYF